MQILFVLTTTADNFGSKVNSKAVTVGIFPIQGHQLAIASDV
jgi:hypothetical protein